FCSSKSLLFLFLSVMLSPPSLIYSLSLHDALPILELDREVFETQDRLRIYCLLITHDLSLNLGLRASFKPSPIKLMDNTVKKMATPGKVTAHQFTKI